MILFENGAIDTDTLGKELVNEWNDGIVLHSERSKISERGNRAAKLASIFVFFRKAASRELQVRKNLAALVASFRANAVEQRARKNDLEK